MYASARVLFIKSGTSVIKPVTQSACMPDRVILHFMDVRRAHGALRGWVRDNRQSHLLAFPQSPRQFAGGGLRRRPRVDLPRLLPWWV